jgi:hypothetical protein
MSNTFQLEPNGKRYYNNLINNIDTFVNVTNLTLYERTLTENCEYYFSNVTSLILALESNKSVTIEHIEYLKMIINLYNLKHLCISNQYILNSSVLLEIFKQAPRLSSLVINSLSLQSFFEDNELCKDLNKMIKKLHLEDIDNNLWNFDQVKQFCEIFSNIEYLECENYDEDNLLFLLNYLPKLSAVQVTLTGPITSETDFFQFEENIRKRNIIFQTNRKELTSIYNFNRPYDIFYPMKIFIWIGKSMT